MNIRKFYGKMLFYSSIFYSSRFSKIICFAFNKNIILTMRFAFEFFTTVEYTNNSHKNNHKDCYHWEETQKSK